MTGRDKPAMQAEGLAFFGRVTAGQSHEVTNVLNIINELAGLQLDLLGAAARGGTVDLPRLAELADRIQTQVARGERIIRNVNRFAHSVDLPTAVFELGDVLEQVVFLAQRTAFLGRVALALRPPEESISLESNPFCIQQAVFGCIELAVSAATDRRRVVVSYRRSGDGVEIEVSAADPVTLAAADGDRLRRLRGLLAELGGELSTAPDGSDRHTFVLFLACRSGGGRTGVRG